MNLQNFKSHDISIVHDDFGHKFRTADEAYKYVKKYHLRDFKLCVENETVLVVSNTFVTESKADMLPVRFAKGRWK